MQKVKAIYYGMDNQAVKIWDEKQGVINPELFSQVMAQQVERGELLGYVLNRLLNRGENDETD